jgi:hypothetical protein
MFVSLLTGDHVTPGMATLMPPATVTLDGSRSECDADEIDRKVAGNFAKIC